MNKMPAAPKPIDELVEPEFKRWTAEEASQLREKSPSVSPWRVIGWQVIAGVVIALGARLVSGDWMVAISAGYGALTVIIPAFFFARGMFSGINIKAQNSGAALGRFFFWEFVKIILTVAMLLAAPRLILNLNWLALLAGFVVTMKTHWVTWWLSWVSNKLAVKIN